MRRWFARILTAERSVSLPVRRAVSRARHRFWAAIIPADPPPPRNFADDDDDDPTDEDTVWYRRLRRRVDDYVDRRYQRLARADPGPRGDPKAVAPSAERFNVVTAPYRPPPPPVPYLLPHETIARMRNRLADVHQTNLAANERQPPDATELDSSEQTPLSLRLAFVIATAFLGGELLILCAAFTVWLLQSDSPSLRSMGLLFLFLTVIVTVLVAALARHAYVTVGGEERRDGKTDKGTKGETT